MMGYEPTAIPTVTGKTNVPLVEKRIEDLKRARTEAIATHELARQIMIGQSKRGFTPFEKGDKVWLEATNLKLTNRPRKMSPKREGPFVITKVLGPLTYQLKLPNQWQIHPVFHAGLLTKYKEMNTHGPNFVMPPPDLIEGDKEYKVEANNS